MTRDPADTDMQCENHVGVEWPHKEADGSECPGPGMPLASSPERAPWLAADPQQAKTYADIAGDYADIAGKLIAELDQSAAARGNVPVSSALRLAQVAATLSVGARIADLTERLGDYLG